MTKYVLIDALNLFHRAKHVVRGDLDTRIGMSLHITFNALRKAWRDLGASHVVFCLEGRSWRKTFYTDYKANRIVDKLKKSKREQEDDEVFFEAFDDFARFFLDQTNCTVLRCPVAEADDLIALWIDLHPDDEHVILSSDTDFLQLIDDKVTIYNGITNQLITPAGYFDDNGKPIIDKKTGMPKETPDPQWVLFEKCIRGDKSDNIFPAFPGARVKGSKNKTGMIEAFEDRNTGGFNWNNFMLQRWTDIEEKEHIVKDIYERNMHLIDLRAQPADIREAVVESIISEVEKDRVPNVGIHFLRFCSKWNLNRIAQYPDEFARMLNAPYNGRLLPIAKEIA
jgi:5'-3' exonuclease